MKKLFDKRFKYKNIIIILIFSLVATIILTFTIYSFININNSNGKVVETESQAQIRSFQTSLNLSRQLVNSSRFTKEAEKWANSYQNASEMDSLIKFLRLMNKELSILTIGECHIGAWKLNTENTSVFYDGTTISEQRLLKNILGIDKTKSEEIIQELRKKGKYVIYYDETTEHEYFTELYYEKYANGEIIYIILIPFEALNVDNTLWFLEYKDRLIGTNDITEYNATIESKSGIGAIKSKYSEVSSLGYEYTYIKDSIQLYFIISIIGMIIVICGIILYLILKAMAIIYEPINRIIDELGIENNGKNIDEIKLFQESIIEVNLLNSKLESIKNDISDRTNERKYFNLLMGYREDIDYNIDKFCVSILEFDNFENGDNVFYVTNDLQVYASKNDDIIFIQLDKSHTLFIHKTDSHLEAEKQLATLLHNYVGYISVKVALTDVYDSIDKLPYAYEFANKILNFKYYFKEKDIILFSDISNIVVNEYNFSVNVEYNLICKVLNADKTAIDLFDKFLRDNISNQNISSSTTEKYILVLINMVNRIFAELKMSPKELLGYNISFTEWLCMTDNPNIIKIIRDTLIDIIDSLTEKDRTGNLEITEKILSYIHENYMKDIMLIDINTEFGISPQRVNTIFKDELDSNFKTYLNEYRIKIAQQIQREDKTIKTTELGELVGFNSSTSFIRVYKKYTGISPQEYQKNL